MNNRILLDQFLSICKRKDYKAAVDFQTEIKSLIPGKAGRRKFKNICGVDISFDKFSDRIFAAASLHSLHDFTIIEQNCISLTNDFPYIPGLLAFREGPAAIKLLRKMKSPVDLLVFDGHGMAHPRGAGIASVIGLLLDKPSIGCAKSRLVGEFEEPRYQKGSTSILIYENKNVGKVLRSRDGVNPIFVSRGYKIGINSCIDIILNCCPKFRIPEPIRKAHILSNSLRRDYLQ
jgi:deoxyribonuclease V